MQLTIAHYVFTPADIQQLRHSRDQQRDSRLKVRFLALLMVAEAVAIETVAAVVGKSVKTIETWGARYLARGIDRLNAFNDQPKQTYLTPPQCEQMVAWVKTTHPAKVKQVRAYIQEQFRVTYHVEAVRQLLHKHGLKRLRPKTQPGNPPNEDVQREWVANDTHMKAACAPGTVFLFLDAMHLVHQNEPGYCWGDPQDPPVLLTNTGRKRLNILGGYNPDEYALLHVTGEITCNGARVVELFDLIAEHHATAPEIILFSDNATYFYAPAVRDWLAAHPTVWWLPLPAYAPNLNLIERLWKFVKEHLVTNTYYKKDTTFRAHAFRLLNHLEAHLDELKTLMVEKFEIIHPKTASSFGG